MWTFKVFLGVRWLPVVLQRGEKQGSVACWYGTLQRHAQLASWALDSVLAPRSQLPVFSNILNQEVFNSHSLIGVLMRNEK